MIHVGSIVDILRDISRTNPILGFLIAAWFSIAAVMIPTIIGVFIWFVISVGRFPYVAGEMWNWVMFGKLMQ